MVKANHLSRHVKETRNDEKNVVGNLAICRYINYQLINKEIQVEERPSQLLRNLSSCEKKA